MTHQQTLKLYKSIDKHLLFFLTLASLIALIGCSKSEDQVFRFPKDKVESFSIYTYDTDSNTTTSNWMYTDKDMKAFLNYLENLSGTKVDTLDTSALSSSFYGVELNVDNPYTLLFIGDYAINYEGEYYEIDGEKAAEMCQSIVQDTTVRNGVTYIANHRYLSLLNNTWDTTYMTASSYINVPLENATLTPAFASINSSMERLNIIIENHTGSTIEFGSKLDLEVLIDNNWYNIDDMINSNVNIAWTSILHMLESDNSLEDSFFLQFHQPLPVGNYRLVKSVQIDGLERYLAGEFNIE